MPSPSILCHNITLPLVQAPAPSGKLIYGCICLHSIFLVTVGLFSYFERLLKIRGGKTFLITLVMRSNYVNSQEIHLPPVAILWPFCSRFQENTDVSARPRLSIAGQLEAPCVEASADALGRWGRWPAGGRARLKKQMGPGWLGCVSLLKQELECALPRREERAFCWEKIPSDTRKWWKVGVYGALSGATITFETRGVARTNSWKSRSTVPRDFPSLCRGFFLEGITCQIDRKKNKTDR